MLILLRCQTTKLPIIVVYRNQFLLMAANCSNHIYTTPLNFWKTREVGTGLL